MRNCNDSIWLGKYHEEEKIRVLVNGLNLKDGVLEISANGELLNQF
jgi:hypothetical protein